MRILKIKSLPSVAERKWIDKDEIMLHACFQLLKDCIEKEKVDTHCDYESNKDFVDELRLLYHWWEQRQNKFTDEIQEKEDSEMLIRLMKIRPSLWT